MNTLIDPVTDVPFGQAMQISLNNYYDLLKAQAGGLGADEFLQLKLVADSIDISAPAEKGGIYEWFSYYNLLQRSDLQIEAQPLSGSVLTGMARVSDIYGKFIGKLSSLVTVKVLSPEDQAKDADLKVQIQGLKDEINKLANADYSNWQTYSKIRGLNVGDGTAFNQWSAFYGNADQIQQAVNKLTILIFQENQLISKTYSQPDDKEIIDAYVAYNTSAMRMCYPLYADNKYLPTILNLSFLSQLPHQSTGQYDDRYVVTFDKTLYFIKTAAAGQLAAKFSKATDDSTSITTDWSYSGSIGYAFISVNVGASDHKTIVEDFQKATELDLSAKAALRVNINYGPWLKPDLFESEYVRDNPDMFQEFFGPNGSLRYYPTAMILIRGFGIQFISSANWTYDYENKFSASAGGGFNVFGINFGDSASYTQDTKEHKVDQSATTLTLSDDANTLRFVGYVVKENTVLSKSLVAKRQALMSK
jgi:hypothetical protein